MKSVARKSRSTKSPRRAAAVAKTPRRRAAANVGGAHIPRRRADVPAKDIAPPAAPQAAVEPAPAEVLAEDDVQAALEMQRREMAASARTCCVYGEEFHEQQNHTLRALSNTLARLAACFDEDDGKVPMLHLLSAIGYANEVADRLDGECLGSGPRSDVVVLAVRP